MTHELDLVEGLEGGRKPAMENPNVPFVPTEQGQDLAGYSLVLAFISLFLAALVLPTPMATVLIAALAVGIIALVRIVLRRCTPIVQLVDRCFAKGEISIEQYQEIKQTLARMPTADYARDFLQQFGPFRSGVGVYKHGFHYYLPADHAR